MNKKNRHFIILLTLFILALFVSFSGDLSTKADNISENKVSNTPIISSKVLKHDKKVEKPKEQGYIFVGDSRFVGMSDMCGICDNNTFVVAEVAQGYKWLVSSARYEIEDIVKSSDNISQWNVIIGLGVNDLYNISNYLSEYLRLADIYNLYVVSVNPIEYHNSITNKEIESFNNELKSLDNIKYIDTYSDLVLNGFSTQDGVHYTNKTYEEIYSYIKTYLNS